VRSNARNPIAAILTLLGVLLSGSPALAADYSVDFGAEIDVGKDAGTIACTVGRTCIAKMESLGLTITFFVLRSQSERVRVELYGGDRGCCYFAGAADSIDVDPRKPLSRGIRARGALLIENERMGTLYLRFNLH
jgi:hypothetical protein